MSASKRITELSPEQIASFPKYVNTWTAIGRCCDPANRPKAECAIKVMYQTAGLAPPEKIVWCSSPLAMGMTTSILKQNGRLSVRTSVKDSVRDSVLDSVRDFANASIRDFANASISTFANYSVGDSVGDAVRASVWGLVGDAVYGQHDALWLAFYRFLRDIGAKKETEPLVGLWALCLSAGWAMPYKGICLISERTSNLNFDDRDRLHCETGPAIEYPDGWGVYSWHGTTVPQEWITGKLDAATAIKCKNMEQRRAGCEIVGWHNVLDQLGAVTIDTGQTSLIGNLLEVEIPDIGKERFLRVRCGTGREFALPVPLETASAEAAQRWINWIPDDMEFIPTIRT